MERDTQQCDAHNMSHSQSYTKKGKLNGQALYDVYKPLKITAEKQWFSMALKTTLLFHGF